jgi:ubiquinone/menaquinone biosynthesis C-methylase UbiE
MTTDMVQTKQASPKAAKPYKGLPMEGLIARWYSKIRQNDQELGEVVRRVSEIVPAGGQILEVAPGPGYLAIELAKLGKYQVVGLDISRSFVQIAQAKAQAAGVVVEFHQGNASAMPFEASAFDFIVCRAAFKNFSAPVEALREMHRVLKAGGRALIIDLRRDASLAEINRYVSQLGLSRINTLLTKWAFKLMLLKSAYTKAEIEQMVAQTDFARCDVGEDAVGMEIWLGK